MRISILFYIYFFSFSHLLIAQHKEIDSLVNLLPTQKEDTLKVDLLLDISIRNLFIQPQKTVSFGIQASNLAKILNDNHRNALALMRVGQGYWSKGDLAQGLDFFLQAKKSNQEGDLLLTGRIIGNIATIYGDIGNQVMSLQYSQEAYKIFEKVGSQRYLATAMNNVSDAFLKLNHSDSAEYYAKNGLKIATKTSTVSILNLTLGEINFRKKHYDTAQVYLQKALIIAEKDDNTLVLADVYKILADIELFKKNTNKAAIYATQAVAAAEKGQRKENMYKAYLTLSKVLAKQEKIAEAYQYHQLYVTYKDSVQSQESKGSLQVFEYELKQGEVALLKKQQEIETITHKQEIRRQQLFVGIVILVLILVALAIGFMLYNRQVIAKYNLLQTEQQVYRLQMNPHFFFNALVAIQDFVVQADGIKASSYISKFARLMRQTLEQSQEEFTNLSSEIETIKYYLDLQQLRFSSKFQYEIAVDENLEIDDIQIPIMLMQPVIENAIEHGLKESNNGKITISFNQKLYKEAENLLQITISDNGVGRNKASKMNSDSIAIPKKHNSMATKILASRKELLQKQANFSLEIEVIDKNVETHKESGTIVCFVMPLKYK
jgi:sensor histidine kinase YesM